MADLRQGGILPQQLPGYQERPAQIEMAMAVSEALDTGQHALIEAPTGVGKSLAYLVALVRSGKVAIISTSNKALQDQLFYKDIPFVRQYVQYVDASLYKGVTNYLCLERLETAWTEVSAIRRQELQDISKILQSFPFVDTGDFDQLPYPVSPELRSRINGDSDQCAWNTCRSFHDCYIRQRYEQAQHAQIIVVNHTLLLLDVASGGAILPEHEVIVLDEAHHLEEEATRVCATTVRYTQITSLLADKRLRVHTPLRLQEEVLRHAGKTWQHLEEQIPATGASAISLQQPVLEALRLADALTALSKALQEHPPGQQSEQEETLYNKLIQRTQRLAEYVRLVFDVQHPETFVYALKRETTPERSVSSVEGSVTPLDVAPWLNKRLFDRWPVICVSATLATVSPTAKRAGKTGPTLDYYKKRVGLDKQTVLERLLPLPYDYQHRALLYVPYDMPPPTYDDHHQATPKYRQAVAERMRQLVMASGGRAFLLFTSESMLDYVHRILVPVLPYPLLRQGELPRAELIHQFRSAGNAVLCGLKSFWEGVDIPGPALSLVVIDRLPFQPPDDPVYQARKAQMKAEKEDWFGGYVLPQAMIQLKQGVGRLLRSDDDRGVIAILDPRLFTKSYGIIIRRALPPARLVTRIEEVKQFLADPPPPGKSS